MLEISLKKSYLNNDKEINTIYFGGGTPSVLSSLHIKTILDKIYSVYSISHNLEITFELNPDDINEQYLLELKKIGINRLSIGLQSFSNDYLQLMNRRHTVKQAKDSVRIAQKIGFNNISVDLIYGLPNSNTEFLKTELTQIIELNVQHISAYHLTIEPKTVFENYVNKGKLREIPDAESQKQFIFLNQFLKDNNFEQYEISNYAKNNMYSKHNSNYWFGVEYIGFGPSAHSYNLHTRHWNIANVKEYIKLIKHNKKFLEEEKLTSIDKYNEYLLTGLRTKWGVDLLKISEIFGENNYNKLLTIVNKQPQKDHFISDGNILYLQKKYWFISDRIISELMLAQ